MPQKILLDTDIGSDIDDSVALAYLLRQPDCELLGITTVSGEPVLRAKLASVICKAAGRGDIPIYPGTAEPLLVKQKQPTAHQAGKLTNHPHDTVFPKAEALEFMRRTVRRHPGEITLLAIGPLTNIALLFAADAEIPSLLKGLVLMCGTFTYRFMGGPCLTEWNARCDPHAAAIVYNAPVKNIISAGLDVTSKVVMEKDEVLKQFDNGILRTVLDFSGIRENERDRVIFHDPLAAALIFDKGICSYTRGNVEIETASERLEGLCYFQPDINGKNEVALEVDGGRFFEHYFRITRGA